MLLVKGGYALEVHDRKILHGFSRKVHISSRKFLVLIG
jgi:hypothetical protein